MLGVEDADESKTDIGAVFLYISVCLGETDIKQLKMLTTIGSIEDEIVVGILKILWYNTIIQWFLKKG